MQEVQVLEATRTAPNSRGRVRSNPDNSGKDSCGSLC